MALQVKGQVGQVSGSSKKKKVRVLLLGGVTKPRDSSAKRRRSRAAGAYLEGVSHDLANVESFLRRSPTFELENKFHDMRYGTTRDVKKQIVRMLRNNPNPDRPLAIYYSGHGSDIGGELCFADANLGWKDLAWLIQKRGNIKIFLDSCYSGDWAVKLESLKGKTKNVEIFAGSHPGASAMDDGKNGGMATGKWLTLWPKLFDEIHKVRASRKAYLELAHALMDAYGCLGKINDDGSYSFARFRDAEAEESKRQLEHLLGMKDLSISPPKTSAHKPAHAANEDDSKQEHGGGVCSRGHPLRLVSHSLLVKEDIGYARGVVCDKCRAHGLGSACSAHCSVCKYDLCPVCHDGSGSTKQRGSGWMAASSLQASKAKSAKPKAAAKKAEKTCDKGHVLLKMSIAQLHAYSHYQSGHFICDGCFASSSKKGYAFSYHCPLCRFDLCPKCFSQ